MSEVRPGFDARARQLAALAWLAGVALLGVRWVSPLSDFYERAILADVLFAAAAACGLAFLLARRELPRPQPWHLWLAAYVAWVAIAALAGDDHSTGAKTWLLVAELAGVAVVTAWLAAELRYAQALGWVMLVVVGVTFMLAVVALGLFYAGHWNGLLGAYGEQFQPSSSYARIRIGFATPPLMASWCIAASAIIAWRGDVIPRRWQVAAQVALGLLVLATFSRAALAFGAVLVVRWAAGSASRARRILAATAVTAVAAVFVALSVGRLHVDPSRPSTVSYTVPDPGNRREAAETSFRTFRQHPFFGSGPGSYPGLNRGQPFRAHFTPLNVAATSGAPALLAITGIVIALWRRRTPGEIAIWSGLLGLALDGMTQDIEHFRHVWVLIGLAAATGRR